MKTLLVLFTILGINTVNAAWVGPPVINYNVTVLENTTASQCPSSWMGQGDPLTPTNLSEYGENTYTAANVLSCSGCAFDSRTRSCVCSTCYNNFN